MLETGGIYIIGVTGVIGMILYLRRFEWVLDLLIRGCTGMLMIYGINMILALFQQESPVGLNLVTIGCVSLLGFPGICLLYGGACLMQFL